MDQHYLDPSLVVAVAVQTKADNTETVELVVVDKQQLMVRLLELLDHPSLAEAAVVVGIILTLPVAMVVLEFV
tara:strand:+ start:247 stop:465 length:219 start_codon:yes stop_codon:yes gene_type:complete